MLVDQRAKICFDVVGRVIHVLTRDYSRDAREDSDDDDLDHFEVQARRMGLDAGDGVVQHVRYQRLEHEADEGEDYRGDEGQSVRGNDGQNPPPPGEGAVPRYLSPGSGVFRAHPAEGIGLHWLEAVRGTGGD